MDTPFICPKCMSTKGEKVLYPTNLVAVWYNDYISVNYDITGQTCTTFVIYYRCDMCGYEGKLVEFIEEEN